MIGMTQDEFIQIARAANREKNEILRARRELIKRYDNCFTTDEVANLLYLKSSATVVKWINGDLRAPVEPLKAIKVGGAWFIGLDDLAEFLYSVRDVHKMGLYFDILCSKMCRKKLDVYRQVFSRFRRIKEADVND